MSNALDELMAKHAATTQGEWFWGGVGLQCGAIYPQHIIWIDNAIEPDFELSRETASRWWSATLGSCGEKAERDAPFNADFIAAAHNTLPQVAADFSALRAERDAAVKRANEFQGLAKSMVLQYGTEHDIAVFNDTVRKLDGDA